MRYLLSKESKKRLFHLLKSKYNTKSIQELSSKIDIPIKTLQSWFYSEDRYIPDKILEKKWYNILKIIDNKEDNWGEVKGGKKAYSNIKKRVGIKGIKLQQSLGGKRASITKEKNEKKSFNVDFEDSLFLEFYGILLGDGWLSNFQSKNEKVWLIGISSNLRLDKGFAKHYTKIIQGLFDRKGTYRIKKEKNVLEFIISHKILLQYLNKKLKFPIGKKINLKISEPIYSLPFNKLKYVIRGIFDTDGSFYLEKNKLGVNSYPIISIHMNSPILIKQIFEILKNEEFRALYDKKNNMIKLKGKEQLNKWINEIGSSNPHKLNKMLKSLKI